MECRIREWKIEDAADLAELLNNKKILNNLRDGLPYPYTKKQVFNLKDFSGKMQLKTVKCWI